MHRKVFFFALAAAACGRIGFETQGGGASSQDASADSPLADSTPPDSDIADSLEPHCTRQELMVTVVDDELDAQSTVSDVAGAGGPADLSLREAILIANNCPGPNTIHFDQTVFPSSTPARISLSALGPLPPLFDGDTTLESIDTGVVLDGGGAGARITTVLDIRDGQGIRVAGLEVQGADRNGTCVVVRNAERVTIDGLRITCTSASATGMVLTNSNLAVLQDNTITADGDAIHVEGSAGVQLFGNTLADTKGTCMLFDRCASPIVSGNTLRRCGEGGNQLLSLLALWEKNVVEGTVSGYGVRISYGSAWLTDNVIRSGSRAGVWVENLARVELAANSITGNGGVGIGFQQSPAVEPPVITGFDAGFVTGTTQTEDGTRVEIFLDPEDEGETFLGSGNATSGAFEIQVTLPPSTTGMTLTATVTSIDSHTSGFSAPWKL